MSSALLRKSIALCLSLLLLFLPATTTAAAAICSCPSDSACCQVDSAETPVSSCCADTEATAAATAGSCCGELTRSNTASPDPIATLLVDDARPQVASPALESAVAPLQLPPAEVSALCAPEPVETGLQQHAYLLFCSLLI